MKVAIINDTHFGVRNDSQEFEKHLKSFYDEVFFPYLEDNQITEVWHLGDLVDRRKYINFRTAKFLRETLLEPLESREIQTKIIPGNHDVYYRNTNKVNALDELIGDRYTYIQIMDRPEALPYGNTRVLFLPWITDDNKEEIAEILNRSTADVVCAHLELVGFDIYKGIVASEGMDAKPFERFPLVLSGHYHFKSNKGAIHYLGNQYDLTWSDYGDPRGFHVFDTDTMDLEYVENPHRMFYKLFYNDEDNDYSKAKVEKLAGKVVRINVIKKTDEAIFQRLIEKINKVGVYELTIVDQFDDRELEEQDVDLSEDTLSVIQTYIENVELDEDHSKVTKELEELYHEAMAVRV